MLSSYFPVMGSKPAPRYNSRTESLERKGRKKRSQWEQKIQAKQQEVHPVLQYEDSSDNLLNLGCDLVKDVLRHVGESNQYEMMRLASTNREVQDMARNNCSYWKDAVAADFNWTARLSGNNFFKLHNFLCHYKWLEGKFIVNRYTTKFLQRRIRRPIKIELLEIEITDTGLLMSMWRSSGLVTESRPLQKKAPFLEVKFADFDDTEHLGVVYHKKVSTLREQEESYGNEWENNGGTVEGFLSRNGSLLNKLINMLDNEHLFSIDKIAANELDSKYLKCDGSWPRALPKPGVYVTYLGQQGFVSYTSDTIRLKFPEGGACTSSRQFDVQVASAFVMPLEEQTGLNFDDYMDYEEGLDGNPKHLNDQHVFHMHADLGGLQGAVARAWYSPSPPYPRFTVRWKIVVVNEDEFFIIKEKGCQVNPWHLRRRPDII